MAGSSQVLLSVVVPIFNEQRGLDTFHQRLVPVVDKVSGGSYEILFCDDGSTDQSSDLIRKWHETDSKIKLVKLSKNFGKEYALSAGIAQASGEAIMMLDGDGQHPVELIPKFVEAWRDGARIVVGIRKNGSDNHFRKWSSNLFYKVFNLVTGQEAMIGSTDFRLIDRSIQKVFLSLTENNRITRGLIDWLGFNKHYIYFQAKSRETGQPTYDHRRRLQLAINSFVSLTPKPLYIFGYVGCAITAIALLMGITILIEQPLLGDPLHWKISGTAMLAVLILFLVGLILISQAILSLYISHIQSQSLRRPLYIIDYRDSVGLKKQADD